MEKIFYNFGEDDTIELLNNILLEGKYLKTVDNPSYGYEQEYYRYNDKIFIITRRNGEYIYIERVVYRA